jgi:imidazole glycerol-phosphate synthase subunit HisH
MNVVVCDYGAGNTRSVVAAFSRLGASPVVSRRPEDVLGAELAVLPGVGAAESAMRGLRETGLDQALRDRVGAGGPTLGICLGLQLALEESEEDGGVTGLGLLPGRAVRLREGRVPRMGWARVEPELAGADGDAGSAADATPALEGGTPALLEADFYFAHSFAAETPTAIARSEGVVAAARRGSFLGVQFHPEKSGAAGARFLAACLSRV